MKSNSDMATGQSILGQRQLDLLAINSNEIATFGNTQSNVAVRFYNLNNVTGQDTTFLGLSNTQFAIVRSSGISPQVVIGGTSSSRNVDLTVDALTYATSVGIGTRTPISGLHLHNANANVLTSNINVINITGRTVSIGTSNPTISSGLQINEGGVWSASMVANTSTCGVATTNPAYTLHVEGNTLIRGSLTFKQVNDAALKPGTYTSYDLFGGANGTKTVVTNDTASWNRVLYTFFMKPGFYIVAANIRFTNLTYVIPLDTMNWATLGVYKASVDVFQSSDVQPVYTCPLVSIGGASDCVGLNTFLNVDDVGGSQYVIAVSGVGHTLRFSGVANVIPVRGIGANTTSISSLQLPALRRSFRQQASGSTYSFTVDGTYGDLTSNMVDVYVSNRKYVNTITVSQSQTSSSNATTFTLILADTQTAGTNVDVVLWAKPQNTSYFSSPYVYQYINNFATPSMNVIGGGIRVPGSLVIDDDIIASGRVFSSCNVATFLTGISSNEITASPTTGFIQSYHIQDLAVTADKIRAGAVTSNDIPSGSITATHIASGGISNANFANKTITENKLSLGVSLTGVGVTTPRANWHVSNYVLANTYTLTNTASNLLTYDLSFTDRSYLLSNPSLTINSALIKAFVDDGSFSTYFGNVSQITPSILYTSGGYLNGGYVNCQGGASVATAVYPFNIASGGTCVMVLAKFESAIVSTGDVLFSVNQVTGSTAPGLQITFRRTLTNARSLTLNIVHGNTVYRTFVTDTVVITNEWALYTVTIDKYTNASVYKNNTKVQLYTSDPSGTFQNDPIASIYVYLCGSVSNVNISYDSFVLFNRLLSASELAAVTSYMLQGTLRNGMQVMQVQNRHIACTNITSRVVDDIAYTSALRVNTLPSGYVWCIDVNSASTLFYPPLPTFNTARGAIEMNASTQVALSVGAQPVSLMSNGMTFVAKLQQTSVGSSTTPVLRLQTYDQQSFINIAFTSGASTIDLTLSPGGDTFRTITALPLGATSTCIVVIDTTQTVSFWINGVLDSSFVIRSLPVDVVYDKTFIGGFNGYLYNASVYNRALTFEEVQQAHNTLTFVPSAYSMQVGNTLNVSDKGTITRMSLGRSTPVKDLIVHIPFDNTMADISGCGVVGSPVIYGNPQVNNSNGRIGSSVFFANQNLTSQHYITYPCTNTTTSLLQCTMTFWMKFYDVKMGGTGTSYGILDVFNLAGEQIVSIFLDVFGRRILIIRPAIFVTTNINPEQWFHIAIQFVNETTMKVFINGVYAQEVSTTIMRGTNAFVIKTITLGRHNFDIYGTTFNMYGELADFRMYSRLLTAVEIQSVATPVNDALIRIQSDSEHVRAQPSGVNMNVPLQLGNGYVNMHANVEGNTYVTSQKYEARDMTNTYASIPLYGNASVVATTPFPRIASEGSLSLPGGTGSFVTLPYTSNQVALASLNSAECWVNYQSYSNASVTVAGVDIPCLFGRHLPTSNMTSWSFGMTSTGRLRMVLSNGISSTSITGTSMIPLNSWQHLAFTMSNTNVRLYLNGVQEASSNLPQVVTYANYVSAPMQITIGAFSNTTVNALVNNVHWVKNNVLYSGSFTPEPTPRPPTAFSSLLLRVVQTNNQTVSIGSTEPSAYNMTMFRNKIINGHMLFDQRRSGVTTTYTNIGISNIFAVDRWAVSTNVTTGSFRTVQNTLQQSDAPYALGFRRSMRLEVASAFTNYATFIPYQTIEYNVLADLEWKGNGYGYPATISFWCRAQAVGTYQISLRCTVFDFHQSFSYSSNNTWQNVSLIVPPPPGDLSGWPPRRASLCIGNVATTNLGSFYGWTLPDTTRYDAMSNTTQWVSTANNFFEVTGVQLEKGRSATSFEFRPNAIELELCQRFYETSSNAISIFPGNVSSSGNINGVNVGGTVGFTTPKRTTAYTVNTYDTANTSGRISAKFATRALTSNITPNVGDRRPTSFYVGISGGASGYLNVAGSTIDTFARGSLIFRWEIDDELSLQ